MVAAVMRGYLLDRRSRSGRGGHRALTIGLVIHLVENQPKKTYRAAMFPQSGWLRKRSRLAETRT